MSTVAKKDSYPFFKFLGDVWRYSQGFHHRLLFWYFIRTIATSLGLLQPVLLARIIDGLSSKTQTFIQILSILILIGAIEIFRALIRNRSRFQINYLADQIRLSVRQSSLSRLLNFDLIWHERQASGKKITIIAKGSDSIKGFIRFIAGSGGGIDILINIGAVLIIFASLHPKYFLVSSLNLFCYLFVFFYLNRFINYRRHLLNKTYERVIGKNFDYFSNMHLIKSLGIGHQINRHLFQRELGYTKKSLSITKTDFDKWVYINLISQIFGTITLALVIFDIYHNRISLGSFFIYYGYISRLQDGLGSVAEWVDEIIDRKLGVFRLVQLLSSGTCKTNCGTRPFPDPFKTIEFNNLSFTYPKTDKSVLSNISFSLVAGDKVGLVGESGSGKSTMSKLILRLYLLSSGQITINGLNINRITSDQLYRHISVAPQECEVFNLPFKDNITIVSDTSTFNPKLYQSAIEIAHCQPILAKIKNNHNAIIGEKGVKLSGGERQRLGIARAIYKDTPIFIFDESTSALDSKTESEILSKIKEKLTNKTIIWIAHRLSTLRFTNRIIVFDQGSIVEDGSFHELVNSRGLFYQLWQLQKRTTV